MKNMEAISTSSIRIDLNEFKLHLFFKNKAPLTFHFNTPSRKFYLSLIALVVHEMKISGEIKTIPIQKHLDTLVLLNEAVGEGVGASDKASLLHRIYTKWRVALPNLEEAPLFKVLGRNKVEAEGAIGKIYSFSDMEKDQWANLFEYSGSEENVRLKFSLNKIGVGLDEAEIVFEDLRNGEAWEKYIADLKGASVDRMKDSLPDEPSMAVRSFAKMGGDPQQEFFRGGITEDTHSIPKVFVIARTPKETTGTEYPQAQSYMPEEPVEKIPHPSHSMESERKLVTVLLAEAANFTSLLETFDPEEAHRIKEDYLRLLTDKTRQCEGTIIQFTGDGIMALFGAPQAQEDHAKRACHAALAIQKGLAEYSETFKKNFGREFKVRIGIHSGPLVVGSTGDDRPMVYTAIGDTLNLASRLKSQAQPGTVLLSGKTQRLVRGTFDLKSLGPLDVKNLDVKDTEEPQETFQLIKADRAATNLEASILRGLTRFVGRKKSMAALMEGYERVREGTGQVVGMVGEAGVGKSRLLLEFRHRLPSDEFGYLEGHCLHYGGVMPYLPILDILRSFFEIKEGEQETVVRERVKERILKLDRSLQGTIPPIMDLLALQVGDEAFLKLQPKQKREKVFEALRDLIIRGSQDLPLILAIEDLHWIDKTTEEFLDYFIGRLARVKVLLLLLHRPEYACPWGSKSYFTRVGVEQLTLKSSAELVKAILEDGEAAPELNDFILNRATGNPLFMEELTHSLLENGSIQRIENQYILVKKASDLQVPDTIQGIIAARMDRLEESAKRTMQAASVIGREFAFSILQAVSEMREGLKSQLLNLQALELIYEKSLFPELEYIFKHALIQEVAYNSLLLKRRKEIHEKIGKAIEDLYPERLEEFYEILAYHYSRSDNLDKACHYLKLSGKKATRNNSLREAFQSFKEALSLLKQMPERSENKREQLEVILLMAGPMRVLAYPEDSFKFLQEGEKLVKELGGKKDRAYLNIFIGNFYNYKGNPVLGRKYMEDSFAEAERIGDIEIMATVCHGLCVAYNTMGEFAKIMLLAPRVIALLEKMHRESEMFGWVGNPYSLLLSYQGLSLAHFGEFKDGEQVLEKSLSFARGLNHFYTIGTAEYFLGCLFMIKGDGANTVRYFRSAIESYEKAQAAFILPSAWCWLGSGYQLLGDFDCALKLMEKALKMLHDLGLPTYMSWIHFAMALVYGDSGHWEEARVKAEQALAFARRNQEKPIEGHAQFHLGRAIGKLEKAHLNIAEDNIHEGMKIFERLRHKPSLSHGYYYLGELYADAGLKEKALENLKKAQALYQEMGMDYMLERTRKIMESVE
jgi:class 3 adenylate cyclase/tetratricopeptide (TPR) repeat protein